MKHESDLHSIISVAMRVQCNASEIGMMSMAHEPWTTSVEYTSLKDKTQVARGISHMIGDRMAIQFTSSLMIYLVNADQLHKHNTMMRT